MEKQKNWFQQNKFILIFCSAILISGLFAVLFGSDRKEGEIITPQLPLEVKEEIITEVLSNEGYTVNYVRLSNDRSLVAMDKKGGFLLQVLATFPLLYESYPYSNEYAVRLISELETCDYTINNTNAKNYYKNIAMENEYLEAQRSIEEFCF